MSRGLFVIGSLGAHAALVLSLGTVDAREAPLATSIQVVELPPEPVEELIPEPQPEPEPEPEPEELPPQTPAPAPTAPAPATEPASSEPAPADDPSPAFDLGLELGGQAGGTGPALAAPPTSRTSSKPVARKELSAAPVEPSSNPAPCKEDNPKPTLVHLPRPAYTAAARQQNIEGKVRVRITVDAEGRVAAATVISGLGHGLDEAALHAARTAQFEPAKQCGRPAPSTFTLSIRFTHS